MKIEMLSAGERRDLLGQDPPSLLVALAPIFLIVLAMVFSPRIPALELMDTDSLAVEMPGCGEPTRPDQLCLTSIAVHDGRLWAAAKNSTNGGRVEATSSDGTALRLGDMRGDLQYRSIVSFEVPSTPHVVAARLRLRRGGISGVDPFTTHGPCWMDISNQGFDGNFNLRVTDFTAPSDGIRVGRLRPEGDSDWYQAVLDSNAVQAIDHGGIIQLRLYFMTSSDGDGNYDYIGFYSGESSNQLSPQLILSIKGHREVGDTTAIRLATCAGVEHL